MKLPRAFATALALIAACPSIGLVLQLHGGHDCEGWCKDIELKSE